MAQGTALRQRSHEPPEAEAAAGGPAGDSCPRKRGHPCRLRALAPATRGRAARHTQRRGSGPALVLTIPRGVIGCLCPVMDQLQRPFPKESANLRRLVGQFECRGTSRRDVSPINTSFRTRNRHHPWPEFSLLSPVFCQMARQSTILWCHLGGPHLRCAECFWVRGEPTCL